MQQQPDGRWMVGAPRRTVILPNLKGLQYLRYLVERPGVDIDALALSDAAAGHAGTTVVELDLGEKIDAQAMRAYRKRLEELDALLDAADARGDGRAAAELGTERDALLDELRGASGHGGRRRRRGASSERARVAVRKAIATAMAQIGTNDDRIGRFLRDSLRTGTSWRYEPNPEQPVTWLTATE